MSSATKRHLFIFCGQNCGPENVHVLYDKPAARRFTLTATPFSIRLRNAGPAEAFTSSRKVRKPWNLIIHSSPVVTVLCVLPNRRVATPITRSPCKQLQVSTMHSKVSSSHSRLATSENLDVEVDHFPTLLHVTHHSQLKQPSVVTPHLTGHCIGSLLNILDVYFVQRLHSISLPLCMCSQPKPPLQRPEAS